MADESDVESVLVGLIAGYLYPNGTSASCAAGVPCSVFRGWPTVEAQELAKARSVAGLPGMVNVSVAARNGVERNVEKYPLVWQTISGPVHTLTATVNSAARTITIGGTVAVPQTVVALIGGTATEIPFTYAVQSNDTLATIAAALSNAIAASFPGTASNGAVITINSDFPITARIVAQGAAIQEVGRQDKSFQITIWAPPCNVAGQDADAWRIAVAKIIDPQLRQMIRIVMPDQVYAHIRYERTITMDAAQSEGLYRRDLYYWVEYATTLTNNFYEIGVAQSILTSAPQTKSPALPLPAGSPTITTNN
jgi:hypothetical protein